jgi:hypothetical protein
VTGTASCTAVGTSFPSHNTLVHTDVYILAQYIGVLRLQYVGGSCSGVGLLILQLVLWHSCLLACNSSTDATNQLLLWPPPSLPPQVERFIFRPGLQDRARYYAVIFLNQLPLSHKVG